MASEEDITRKKASLHDIATRRRRNKVVYEGDLGHYIAGDSSDAKTYAANAKEWAIKVDGAVQGDEYSSKYWAKYAEQQGGGSHEWADVSKQYAVGLPTEPSEGSSKHWSEKAAEHAEKLGDAALKKESNTFTADNTFNGNVSIGDSTTNYSLKVNGHDVLLNVLRIDTCIGGTTGNISSTTPHYIQLSSFWTLNIIGDKLSSIYVLSRSQGSLMPACYMQVSTNSNFSGDTERSINIATQVTGKFSVWRFSGTLKVDHSAPLYIRFVDLFNNVQLIHAQSISAPCQDDDTAICNGNTGKPMMLTPALRIESKY